jgi:hypothetical protein
MDMVLGSGCSLKHLFACGFSHQVLLPMKIERCMLQGIDVHLEMCIFKIGYSKNENCVSCRGESCWGHRHLDEILHT